MSIFINNLSTLYLNMFFCIKVVYLLFKTTIFGIINVVIKMARRFIVDSNDILINDDKNIKISGTEVKHVQVLRHEVDDEIIINKYICKIKHIGRDYIELEKLKDAPVLGVPNINLTLYIAVLKNDKLDLVVQKAVELGVKTIIPFISNNVVVKLDEKGKIKRKEKLQKIANEACKQCGRSDEVVIKDIISFKELVNCMSENEINFFAYENEKDSLHNVISNKSNLKDISCIIGPEGGFTKDEASILKEIYNVSTISLGTRILRAETAAINVISIIMYEYDR